MTVSDRDAILAMRSPGDLFEAQDDPRELKRAYAVLAKRWRADAEVSAHVRSLYEAARNPVRSDVPPAEALEAALSAEAPLQVARIVGEQRDHLLSTDPGLVERALLFCVPFAVQMPADLLDGLEALIDDPGWDAKALSDYYDLVFDMAIARELAWARRANSVPAVLCDALEQAPGRSPAEVAQLWLRTAEALGTDGLDATFERLEQDHPTLLGAWSRHELTMTTVAISKGAVVPDLAQWRKRYQTSFECDAKARRTGELRKFGVLLLALIPLLPYLKIFALLLAIGWMYAIFKVFPSLGPDALAASRLAVLHAEPIEPLFELASAHGLFPRELASQLVPTKSFPLGRVLLEDAHPVFQLDRSDTALLRCIRPAHVERLR